MKFYAIAFVLLVPLLSASASPDEQKRQTVFVDSVPLRTPIPESKHTPIAKIEPKTTTAAGRSSGCNSLEDVKRMESGGRYDAVSSSGKYRGAYQFDQPTWESNGGTGDPASASPAEQDRVAEATYARRGYSPWGVC